MQRRRRGSGGFRSSGERGDRDCGRRQVLAEDDAPAFIAARARHLAAVEREFMKELGLTLPAEEFGDADIDTDDDD